jgi:hypothetical protein
MGLSWSRKGTSDRSTRTVHERKISVQVGNMKDYLVAASGLQEWEIDWKEERLWLDSG